jgi:superfamily II DNA or RNA helicase
MQQARWKIGDTVRRRLKSHEIGVVYRMYASSQANAWMYVVQFGQARSTLHESDLEDIHLIVDDWEALTQGQVSNAADFKALLTYERLRRPPSRIAASFGAAKAAFYPHQFKPLLKFLESDGQRLLIADDVGLGKTIEAGYVLRELQARSGIERALIVVPSRLCSKWKDELERRFAEKYDVIRAKDLLALKGRMQNNQDPGGFRWIISLESARDPQVIEFLTEFELSIDVVVIDEAHRMRNRGTEQHRLGRALSNCADAMLMLSATPVQTSLENLFRLLNILQPGEFSDPRTFERQYEANRCIVQAANAVRGDTPSPDRALEALAAVRANAMTRNIAEPAYFDSLDARIRACASAPRDARVSLQRDIMELSFTNHVLSRTRKADVIVNRARRRALTLTFELNDVEQAFYGAVQHLYRLVHPKLDGWGQAMATQMAWRWTASCVPAAARKFREMFRLETAAAALPSLDIEGLEDGAEERRREVWHSFGALGGPWGEAINALRAVLEKFADDPRDSKGDRLMAAIHGAWADDAEAGRRRRKVVVFAYFKPTLRHLRTRLQAVGIDVGLIDGDVPMAEREAVIERFCSGTDFDVLLSSEVGSEGLDLQQASIVVNYDLPWNPMVVEQRIGRLDRIGQASETILIVNLVAAGTIEEHMLARLYLRIDLFESSIGEIDAILGDTVFDLMDEALRGGLSSEEQKRRADENAEATLRQLTGARVLVEEATALLAADQAFLDEIEAMVGRRRVPAPAELHLFLKSYLMSSHQGARLPETLVEDVGRVVLPATVFASLRAEQGHDPEAMRVASRVAQQGFLATFDQGSALQHSAAELIHARHPLVRLAFSARDAERTSMQRVHWLRLPPGKVPTSVLASSDESLVYAIHMVVIGGSRARNLIAPMFIRDNLSLVHAEAASDLLLALLESGESFDADDFLPDEQFVEEARVVIDDAAAGLVLRVREDEAMLDRVRQQRLRQTVGNTLDARVRKLEERAKRVRRDERAPFAIRMADAKLELAKREREARLAELHKLADVEVELELVGIGMLTIC